MLNSLSNIVIYGDPSNIDIKQYSDQQDNQKQEFNHDGEIRYQLSSYKLDEYRELIDELSQARKGMQAVRFRLRKLVNKVFKGFNISNKRQRENQILSKYFDFWKQETLIKKIQCKIIKVRVFKQLSINRQIKFNKNMDIIKQMTADNSYERCLKATIFIQWKLTIKTQKKYRQLVLAIKKNKFSLLTENIQQRKTNRFTKELAMSIYKQKLLKKYFMGLNEGVKINKVQEIISIKHSKMFLKRIKKYFVAQRVTYQQFYNKNLLLKTFRKLQENWKFEKYDKYYKKHLMKKYFKQWIKEGRALFIEKQQEAKNQEIVDQYLKRKYKVKLLYCFEIWKKNVEEKVQNKKKNQIAKQYGQVKEKQFLLRKYFNAMKQLKICNLVDKFYQRNLKNKVFVSLKQQIIKTSQKYQNLYKFVQNRQKRKYFNAINTFIKQDLLKVLKFRTQKAWYKFSFGIVKNYVELNRKADQFYSKNLKFKTIFGLKQQLEFKNKTNKAIIVINANMNLRRWRKNHKIRQFVQQRKFVIIGKIFRQLKLLRMNKIWSSPQIEYNRNTQKKTGFFSSNRNNFITQTSVSFDKITMESPQKLFSLDYSMSAYNSNNVFDNM